MASTTSPILSTGIPIEIYLAIADFLPLSSKVALTLTSKTFLHIFGIKRFDDLLDNFDERRDFLLLLERDLPNNYLDYEWNLALKKQLPSMYPHRYLKESSDHNLSRSSYQLLRSRFNYSVAWSHLILALKRHAYGDKHGLSLDAFRHEAKSIIILRKDCDDRHNVQLSIEPKVVTGRLLLRCTYHISHTTSHRELTSTELKLSAIETCWHVSTTVRHLPWYDNSLARCLSAKRYTPEDDESDDEDIQNPPEPDDAPQTLRGRCSFCMTDWCVAPSEDNRVFTITTWQNLGNGDDPEDGRPSRKLRNPGNEVWKAFAGIDGMPRHKSYTLKYPVGSIQTAFETGQEGLAAVEATLRNR